MNHLNKPTFDACENPYQSKASRVLKILFFALIIKPLVLIVLGLNVRNKHLLLDPRNGIIAANHNSHLDTMVIMSLFPLSQIHKVKPVAAADYFFRNPLMRWFSEHVLDLIPLDRHAADKTHLFDRCHDELNAGNKLIVFPEGTRGDSETIAPFKKGVFHLAKEHSDRLIVPVMLRGLGKSLPKGTALFVPFNCDVIVGEPLKPQQESAVFMTELKSRFNNLEKHCLTRVEGQIKMFVKER